MKQCSQCAETKPVDEFNKRAASKDGLHAACKSCRKKAEKRYKASDKGRAREKRYRESDKGKATQRRCSADWLSKNAERYAETQAKWKRRNPEYSTLRARKYYATSSGRATVLASQHRRRARERNAPTDARYPEWVSMTLQMGLCFKCESTEDLTVDHVVPLSLGGGNTADNLQPLCRRCNSSKSAKSCDDYRVTELSFSNGSTDRRSPSGDLHRMGPICTETVGVEMDKHGTT